MNKLFQSITCSNDDTLRPTTALPSSFACDTSKLIIRDMTLSVSIGVNAAEKHAPQSVIISIEANLCDAPDCERDDIADVLSYDDIVKAVKDITRERHINLVETLAEDIANALLSMAQVVSCTVRVEKPDIYKDIGSVGVEITRHRGTAR